MTAFETQIVRLSGISKVKWLSLTCFRYVFIYVDILLAYRGESCKINTDIHDMQKVC